ncbi:MAG TPA: NYN domain-containing protein [Candidatus Saccharimonadales bacterium]|nr:NYN domain-containing protein [Candidatus Saccharimonadales bacterium]
MKKIVPIVYAFIDSQNLNLGVQSAGWKLDFAKFRLYLKNKYSVSKAYLFIGQLAGNELLYDRLQDMGYHLILKPTTQYKANGKIAVKGNVDAELVLYAAAKVYDRYDQAILVSGDGDFTCLSEYLTEKGKLAHIFVPNKNYSQLLGKFLPVIVRVDLLRQSLEYKKDQRRRSVETLGLSGHGDNKMLAKQRQNVKKRR